MEYITNESELRIKIHSAQYEISNELLDGMFDDLGDGRLEEYAKENPSPLSEDSDAPLLDMITDGKISFEDGMVKISYNESELTGMEGAITTLSFSPEKPDLISMLRGGSVTTALVFEPFTRHICIYETPIMPFELCIYTISAKNTLLIDGKLYLDYIVEIKGSQAERTCFKMKIEKKEGGKFPPDKYE